MGGAHRHGRTQAQPTAAVLSVRDSECAKNAENPSSRVKKRRAARWAHAVQVAQEQAGQRGAQRQAWVVDTGASRHVCPPAAAGPAIEPCETAVETANGRVAAVGRSTVRVSGLGDDVDALVLKDAPCLLSAGQLVRQGYELHWARDRCILVKPCGSEVVLAVTRGIPTLGGQGDEDATTADAGSHHALAVREGMSDEHRQSGHYPWRDDCGTCAAAALRSAQHRRRPPHQGVLAVDLASVSPQGPHVMVGATQSPGYTYAQPLRSRAARDLRDPLFKIILAARQRGEVAVVHTDQEPGMLALEGELLGLGVRLSTTQGGDPQANGCAENAVGRLSRMARAVLHGYDEGVARQLWQQAMVWSAQKLEGPDIPPFGARVMVRHTPAAVLGKLRPRAVHGVFLHRSLRTPGAATVGLLADDVTVSGVVGRRTWRAACATDGRWAFPMIKDAHLPKPPASGGDVGTGEAGMDGALSGADDLSATMGLETSVSGRR